MKKYRFTLILLVFLLMFAAGCTNENNGQLSFNTNKLDQEISDLGTQLEDAQNTINDQKDYISELSEQLADLQDVISEADFNSDNTESTESTESGDDATGNSDYTEKYPNLYPQAEADSEDEDSAKFLYLTFDDGPSSYTPKVLDLLDEYDAKATFFVVYTDNTQYTQYLSEIVKRGHTLAIHSYSHDYGKIYASVDAFLEDFNKVYEWVYEETGQRPTLYRFPGGSTKGNRNVVKQIIAEMERRGFTYYDWNVSSGDGNIKTKPDSIISNICDNVSYIKTPVVLMHDGPGKKNTYEALPTVLENLKNMGYTFLSLNEGMDPVQYLGN